eukprot:TRINITY_DN62142_c0_g1_i1.p1 TRINITY_DN62142_c0_g1~~TRINITY_DN62142_c0_g1_i1.p1  ORF type:complete len:385 (-),score=26.00 TRINITY_DN62142_c0_g1_i1:263-1417(-)
MDASVVTPLLSSPSAVTTAAPMCSLQSGGADVPAAFSLASFSLGGVSDTDIPAAPLEYPLGTASFNLGSASNADVPATFSLSSFSLGGVTDMDIPAAPLEYPMSGNNYFDDLPPVGGQLDSSMEWQAEETSSQLIRVPELINSTKFAPGTLWTFIGEEWVSQRFTIKISNDYLGMGAFKVAMKAELCHEGQIYDVVVKMPHTSISETVSDDFINGQMQRDVCEQTQVAMLLKWLQGLKGKRGELFQGMNVSIPSIASLDCRPDVPFIIERELQSFSKDFSPAVCEVIDAMRCLILKATRGAWLIEDVQGQENPAVVFSDVQLKTCNGENEARNGDALDNNILPFWNNHTCNCHCAQPIRRSEVVNEQIWDQVSQVDQCTPFALN